MFNDRTRKTLPFNKGDCVTDVTTSARLNVCLCSVLLIAGNNIQYMNNEHDWSELSNPL